MRVWPVSSLLVERAGQRLFRTVVLALGFVTSSGAAESSPMRVLLLSAAQEDPLFARIAAELTSQGFQVEEDRVAKDPSVERLAELTSEASADAGVVVRVAARSIHVAIVDRIHDQRLSASIGLGRDRESRSVAALRTVEFVRTTLVDLLQPATRSEPARPELNAARSAPRERREVQNPDAARRPEPADARGGRIGLGFSGAPGPDGGEAAWHAGLSVRYFLAATLGVEGLVLVPLNGSNLSAEQGSVELRFALAGAGMAWEPRVTSSASGSVGVGAGGLLVRTEGQGSPGYRGHLDYGVMFGPYLRLGFTQDLTPRLSVRADVLGTFAMPETVLLVGEQRVGSFGQPSLLAALGLEWEAL